MKKVISMMVAASVITGAAACKPTDKEAKVVRKAMSLKFDPGLDADQQKGLVHDVFSLLQQEVKPEKGSYYDKAFAGTDTPSVVRYMDDRINYIIPQIDDVESRLKVIGKNEAQVSKAIVLAANVGMIAYLEAEANKPKKVGFQIGNSVVPVTSSRVGIIELGDGYKPEYAAEMDPQLRIATLIHEARHSDCTGGLDQNDIAQLQKGELPNNRKCGYLHDLCPAGHPLAGEPGCDGFAWGAYSIESLYSVAVAKTCANCTETTKQQATATAMDSLSRVTVLDDMLAGKLGDPDMSSSGSPLDRVRKDIAKVRAERAVALGK